jgi:hypothetical protein
MENLFKMLAKKQAGDEEVYPDSPRNYIAGLLPDKYGNAIKESLADQKDWVDNLPEQMGMATTGITRAEKELGSVLGKSVNEYASSIGSSGNSKLDVLSHFRKTYPAAIEQTETIGKRFQDFEWAAREVKRYKDAVKFLKEKGYLPADQSKMGEFNGRHHSSYYNPEGEYLPELFKKRAGK